MNSPLFNPQALNFIKGIRYEKGTTQISCCIIPHSRQGVELTSKRKQEKVQKKKISCSTMRDKKQINKENPQKIINKVNNYVTNLHIHNIVPQPIVNHYHQHHYHTSQTSHKEEQLRPLHFSNTLHPPSCMKQRMSSRSTVLISDRSLTQCAYLSPASSGILKPQSPKYTPFNTLRMKYSQSECSNSSKQEIRIEQSAIMIDFFKQKPIEQATKKTTF